MSCPECGSTAIETDTDSYRSKGITLYTCDDCGHEWETVKKTP